MGSFNGSDLLLDKVELILESPTEREKYKKIKTEADQLAFFCNHFIMDDMSVRLIKRQFLLSQEQREKFIDMVDGLLTRLDR